jgi:hypothetical protein
VEINLNFGINKHRGYRVISICAFCISFVGCLPLELIKVSSLLKMQCGIVVGIIALSAGVVESADLLTSVGLGIAFALPVRGAVGLFQYAGELIDWCKGQSLLEWADPVSQQQLSSIGGVAGFIGWIWSIEQLVKTGGVTIDLITEFSSKPISEIMMSLLQHLISSFQFFTEVFSGVMTVGGLLVVLAGLAVRFNSCLLGAVEVVSIRWAVVIAWGLIVTGGLS